jgi:hypothetical protein
MLLGYLLVNRKCAKYSLPNHSENVVHFLVEVVKVAKNIKIFERQYCEGSVANPPGIVCNSLQGEDKER